MKPKIVAVRIVMTLIFTATFMSLNYSTALINTEQKKRAETLLTILDNDNKTIRAAMDRMDTQNISVLKDVKTTYKEGITHAQEAIRLINQENYDGTNIEAIEAMKKFRFADRYVAIFRLILPQLTNYDATWLKVGSCSCSIID